MSGYDANKLVLTCPSGPHGSAKASNHEMQPATATVACYCEQHTPTQQSNVDGELVAAEDDRP